MNRLPSELYRSAQIRQLEEVANELFAISPEQLMERAGQAAFELLQARWPQCRRITVVCGSGNNGGDGYVVARLAHQAGWAVRVAAVDHTRSARREAALAREGAAAAGVEVVPFEAPLLHGAEVVVDALFGTGLTSALGTQHLAVIDALNQLTCPILALDVPSGIDADTGAVSGGAVHANATLSFIGLKPGLFTGAAPDHCGTVEVTSLGIPAEAYQGVLPAANRYDYAAIKTMLAPRARTSHKGNFGHLLIVGGDHGMLGAAQLAARAAGRVGAGLVSLATRRSHASLISAVAPEVMAHGVDSAAELSPLLARASVVAVGPGLGQGAWGRDLFSRLLEARLPLVVDADGLNLLAQEPLRRDDWILTPHPGEAARLLGCGTGEVQADRFAAASAIAANYGGTCILKGSGTLVQRPAALPLICSDGNPGMASGGMGDLLTGVVGALMAQGIPLDTAAAVGVALHGAAGDAAAREGGERGLLASDLLPHLRRLANPQFNR